MKQLKNAPELDALERRILSEYGRRRLTDSEFEQLIGTYRKLRDMCSSFSRAKSRKVDNATTKAQ